MELIRRDTDYALRVLIELARRGTDAEPAPVDALVRATETPRDFLHKILRRLAESGIVEGVPGRGGGYRLKRPAEEISLLEVVSVVQGLPAVNRCLLSDSVCSRTKTCPVRKSLEGIQRQLVDQLEKARLSEIAAEAGDRRSP
jgi:Rrf2 family protein